MSFEEIETFPFVILLDTHISNLWYELSYKLLNGLSNCSQIPMIISGCESSCEELVLQLL